MNTRIRALRRSLDLTQQVFAERIGLRQNSIALIESGKRNISDYSVRVICREFNVNEDWLRTGHGDMFLPTPSTPLDTLAEQYNLSRGDYALIEKYINLKPEIREALVSYVRTVAASLLPDISEQENPQKDSVAAAEAAYEQALGFAQNTSASALNTTDEESSTG